MDDREARLKCLELAVQIAPRSANDPAKAVEEIASQFYNHINQSPPSSEGGLTARVDKQAVSPTKKR